MENDDSGKLTQVRSFVQGWLHSRNLKAATLSRISGLPPYTLSRILNGKVNEVELETATRIYRVMYRGMNAIERVQLLQWLGLGTVLETVSASDAVLHEAELPAAGIDRDQARTIIEGWLRDNRVSQAELARRAGIDASRIGRFLRGNIESKTAARIFGAVHASFDTEQRHSLLRALGLHEIVATVAQSIHEPPGAEAG